MTTAGSDWSDDEIEAATAAYLEMLEHQENSKTYSKAEYRRKLIAGPLKGRSESSVEYRMQNISATLEELCMPILQGYPPAKNVGNRVKDRIRHCIGNLGAVAVEDFTPVADEQTLSSKTTKLLSRTLSGKPRGQDSPRKTVSNAQTFVRDPLVRAWVLQQANGRCECCMKQSPFTLPDGTFYLEVHHVKHLADGGSDRVENAVAVCPNCHRHLHLGSDRGTKRDGLYCQLPRLVRE